MRKVLSSNGKCIDECYEKTNCVAVDFCVHCSSKDSKYNVCHMYDEIKTKCGRKDEKWETKILVPEIEKQFVLQDTAVVGIERSLDNNSSVVTLHAHSAHVLIKTSNVRYSPMHIFPCLQKMVPLRILPQDISEMLNQSTPRPLKQRGDIFMYLLRQLLLPFFRPKSFNIFPEILFLNI